MPRSMASPGPNMSTVDRLSIPKERSKGMELTGYTLLERLREMRDIMKVKEARMERLQQVTREEHDLQEKVITLLRKEIKVKETIIIKAGKFEQQVVSRVLKDDRRPRLQMRNADIQGAMYALGEWFSFQKNVLNLIRSSQTKREKYYERKQREIKYLDQISSTVDEAIVRKSVRRYENNIEKLKVRYKTAQLLQTSYENILDRYHQESLLLGHRLEAIEKALQMHHMELMDLLEMKAEIEITLDHTLRQLPRTEKAVQKASLERREIEGATRKTERDLRVEKLLSRQRRRSEKMDVEDEDDNELQKEENTTQMLNIQHDFDTIKSQTSAADTNAILEAFVKLTVVHDEVTELKRQKERERERLVEELERLKTDRQRRNFDEQNAISRGKKLEEEMRQRILDEEKELERKTTLLKSRGDILFQIDKGVSTIFEKLLTNQQQGVTSVDATLFHSQRDATGSSTSDQLYSCQRVLTALHKELESLGTFDQEEALTGCLLFGEMVDDHLDLLIPAGTKLVPRKDAEGLNEFEYDQKEIGGILTREEMKKQHKKFYDMRKRRASHNRSSAL